MKRNAHRFWAGPKSSQEWWSRHWRRGKTEMNILGREIHEDVGIAVNSDVKGSGCIRNSSNKRGQALGGKWGAFEPLLLQLKGPFCTLHVTPVKTGVGIFTCWVFTEDSVAKAQQYLHLFDGWGPAVPVRFEVC